MSVASISDATHITTVADEIESFFNVILYNALRYLPHNIQDDTQTFIRRYFSECVRVRNDTITCGGTRSHLIQSGKLRHGMTPIVFQSKPLNEILRRLLEWFHAMWEVRKFEQAQKDEQATAAAMTDSESQPGAQPPSSSLTTILELVNSVHAPANMFDFPSHPVEDAGAEPSDEIKALAKTLNNHDAVRALFWSATMKKSWLDRWPPGELKIEQGQRPSGTVAGTLDETPSGTRGARTVESIDRPQQVTTKRTMNHGGRRH